MFKRALVCITLIAGGTFAVLNSKAPANTAPTQASTACVFTGNLPETAMIDRTFVFAAGEAEVALNH